MRAWIPAAICLAVFVYSCSTIYQARRAYFAPDSRYQVDIVVKGPDGKVIPPVERVQH